MQSKYTYLIRFIEGLINKSTGIPSPLLKKGSFYKYLSIAIEASLIGSFTLLLVLYSLTTISFMLRAALGLPKTEPLSVVASIEHLHRADTIHILFLAIEIFLAVLIFILEVKIEKIDFNFMINRPSVLWLYNVVKKSTIGRINRAGGRESKTGHGYNGFNYEELATIFSGDYNYSARTVMENVVLLFIYLIILLFMVKHNLGWNVYLVLTTGIILTMPIIAEVLANLTDPGRIIYGAISYIYKPEHFYENLHSNTYIAFVVAPVAVIIGYYAVLLQDVLNSFGRTLPVSVKLIIAIQIFFIVFTTIAFVFKRTLLAYPTGTGLYFLILGVFILFISPALYYLAGYPYLWSMVILSALFTASMVLNYMIYFGIMCQHSNKRLLPWCWVKVQIGRWSITIKRIRKIRLSDYYRLYASYILGSLASAESAEFSYYGFEMASLGFVELVLEWSATGSIESHDVQIIRDSGLVGLMKALLNHVAEEEISDLLTILVFEAAVISLIRLEKSRKAQTSGGAGPGSGNLIYLSTSLLLAFVLSAFMYEYYKNMRRRTLQHIRRLRILMLPMMMTTKNFVNRRNVEGLLIWLKTLGKEKPQAGATWGIEVATATLVKLFRALYNIKLSSSP